MEKTAKKLAVLKQKSYKAWKAYYKVYKQIKGREYMVDMMEPDVQEYCAVFICEIEQKVALLLENFEISDILDLNFEISIANYYEITLLALYAAQELFA